MNDSLRNDIKTTDSSNRLLLVNSCSPGIPQSSTKYSFLLEDDNSLADPVRGSALQSKVQAKLQREASADIAQMQTEAEKLQKKLLELKKHSCCKKACWNCSKMPSINEVIAWRREGDMLRSKDIPWQRAQIVQAFGHLAHLKSPCVIEQSFKVLGLHCCEKMFYTLVGICQSSYNNRLEDVRKDRVVSTKIPRKAGRNLSIAGILARSYIHDIAESAEILPHRNLQKGDLAP